MTPDELPEAFTEYTPGPDCIVHDPQAGAAPPRIQGFSVADVDGTRLRRAADVAAVSVADTRLHPVEVFRYFEDNVCEHSATEARRLWSYDQDGRARGSLEVLWCTLCGQPVGAPPEPLLWDGDQA